MSPFWKRKARDAEESWHRFQTVFVSPPGIADGDEAARRQHSSCPFEFWNSGGEILWSNLECGSADDVVVGAQENAHVSADMVF